MVRFNQGRVKDSCASEACPVSQGSTRKKKPVMLKPTIQISEKDVLKRKPLPPTKDKSNNFLLHAQGEATAVSMPGSFQQGRPPPTFTTVAHTSSSVPKYVSAEKGPGNYEGFRFSIGQPH